MFDGFHIKKRSEQDCRVESIDISNKQEPQVSTANLSKFRRPVCQSPWVTMEIFHIQQLILYSPLNPTKYQYLSLVTATDTLAIFQISSIFSVFFELELEWQSCISRHNHVFGHLNLTKICYICALMTSKYQIPQHSAKIQKFRGNGQILQPGSILCVVQKTVVPTNKQRVQ